MSPETRALRQTVEALAFEGILTPLRGGWLIGGVAIRAPHRIQATGRVRLTGDPLTDGGAPLTFGILGRALRAAGHDATALLDGVRRSAAFLRQAGATPANRHLLRGPALETALIEGHPYHPCFKSRTGFSDADNLAFGPEGGRTIRPLWLQARGAIRHGTDVARGLAPAGAIPVHPWQWQRLQADVAPMIADGSLCLLPHDGPDMQATASLRTLAPLDGGDHLKMSLAVGVTSSLRNLLPWSVAVAPAISDWLAAVVASDPALADLSILREHGAVIMRPDALGGRLAAIRREAPPANAVPVSALSLGDGAGGLLIDPWLRQHGTTPWIKQFLRLLRPVWHLMGHHGIGLEAHGQNLAVVIHDGWPVRLIARDFSESLEYVPELLARTDLAPDLGAIDPAFDLAPPGEYHRMGHATDLRDLVMDCLVVHVLSEIADALHRTGRLPEDRFWSLTRAALPALPDLASDADHIPAESLASRLLGRTAVHPAPNPLGKNRPMTETRFRLNDRLIDPSEVELPDMLEGQDPDRTRIGVHLSDKAHALTAILQLRRAGASCHPIAADTPPAAALALARQSGCNRMVTDQGIIVLDQDAPHAPGGVLIQTSSGTTGTPKIIARSWAQIATEIDAYIRAFPEAAKMTPVIAASVTHSYGLIAGVMVGQARGHVPVVIEGANPRRILRVLAATDRPVLYAAPPLLNVLARFAGEGGIHAAMSSGTVLPRPWFDALRRACRHLFQQYGCSEAGCCAIAADPRTPEDMGAPLPHLRIAAGTDTPAPVIVTADGHDIATGDLGVIDSRGHLVFAGREAEVIDVAGFNIHPADIEAAAMSCPGINDAVAFPIPDPDTNQRPALAFAGTASEDALRAHLDRALSPRQRPVRIVHLPALPRGANGKIARRDLATRLSEEV
ncbi:IucA/IucC family protein [Paracoccus sp. PARArs4]|uniref:IucA/IucC family protein n=1 Tax=Paracoccus sp. PARArs4 TaxID=2853442 RepID=UPI0024A7530B|nr:IucA/IucC family protein [Paracoccus sp. PARArs4]